MHCLKSVSGRGLLYREGDLQRALIQSSLVGTEKLLLQGDHSALNACWSREERLGEFWTHSSANSMCPRLLHKKAVEGNWYEDHLHRLLLVCLSPHLVTCPGPCVFSCPFAGCMSPRSTDLRGSISDCHGITHEEHEAKCSQFEKGDMSAAENNIMAIKQNLLRSCPVGSL